METKDVIYELRTGKGLSQEELAEKVFVTRQAVSRWETGETVPNTETLKLLSALFDVSINTLLGTPRQLICQCCGMPLEDGITSREPDGSYNTASPAGSQTAAIMRITASGAMRRGPSLTKARMHCWIFCWRICRTLKISAKRSAGHSMTPIFRS